MIYTASEKEYADAILDNLDKYKIINKRYYRQDCVLQGEEYFKDLNRIDADLKKVFMVDNIVRTIRQRSQVVPISSWKGRQDDIELSKLSSNIRQKLDDLGNPEGAIIGYSLEKIELLVQSLNEMREKSLSHGTETKSKKSKKSSNKNSDLETKSLQGVEGTH